MLFSKVAQEKLGRVVLQVQEDCKETLEYVDAILAK